MGLDLLSLVLYEEVTYRRLGQWDVVFVLLWGGGSGLWVALWDRGIFNGVCFCEEDLWGG